MTNMIENIEIDQISIELQEKRFANSKSEGRLLSSLSSVGILEPFLVVQINEINGKYILIDGFKRYRAAKVLKINIIPIKIIGNTVEDALLKFFIIAKGHKLHFLEEALLIREMIIKGNLTTISVANDIKKSVSWVSMRINTIDFISNEIHSHISSGNFPPSSIQAIIPSFKRLKKGKAELEEFVKSTSGKFLSHREILSLAELWCKNDDKVKNEIKEGKLRILLSLQDNFKKECSLDEKLYKNIAIANNYLNKILNELSTVKDFSPLNNKDGLIKVFIKVSQSIIEVLKKTKNNEELNNDR